MNNNKTTTAAPTDNTQLIQKLRNEYAQLKERVGSLHSFLCDIDFEQRVPDPVEQRLMRDQLHMMLGYMDNLRQRISYQEEQQLRNMIETSISHVPIASVEKRGGDIIIKQANPSGQDISDNAEQTGDGKRVLDFVRDENGKVVAIVPECLIPKGLDDVDLDKAFDELAKAWEAYNKESHEIETHHCRPGRPKSVNHDDGPDAVEEPIITGESIKKLMDYQVVGVCEPGFPCEGCVQDHYNTPCVKVELVGGYMLCLAPLPNSIMMDKPCS